MSEGETPKRERVEATIEKSGEANMHNPAKTDYPVHDLIQNRWSPRAFSDHPVSPETLRSLFEAARWAPSSSNEQPWAFIVGTKDTRAGDRRVSNGVRAQQNSQP
jgi:Nitroreductase family